MINPKVGDVLVYKSDADRLGFIGAHECNKEIDESYNDGLVVSSVNNYNKYEINNLSHIYESDLKHFKIKEEKMLKPDDIISVEMTALDGMRLLGSVGKYTCADMILNALLLKLNMRNSDFCDGLSYVAGRNWSDHSRLTKAALAQFKDPNQEEIDALEKIINDAAAKLARIKNGK